MLWAVFTVLAAAGQTARNAMQRELTATLGTAGATHVRFLFGFPFALLFLRGRAARKRRGAAAAGDGLLDLGDGWGAGADRGHSADARRDERALFRGRLRLYQN